MEDKMKSGLSLIVSKIYLIGMLFSIFFITATSSFAGNYYVSPSGAASWGECTNINTPCSAETGLANAQAGDVVYFRGGTYMAPVTESSGYTPAFRPSHSGVEGNPITFKAYPGEVPFINNSNNQGSAHTVGGFGVYYKNYIVWDGFHTKSIADTNNQAKAVLLYNADYCTIKNCVVEGYTSGQSNNCCIRADYTNHLIIENNKLFNSQGDSTNSAGVQTYHASYMQVRDNDIYDCTCGLYDKTDGQYNKYYRNHVWNSAYGIHINIKWETCNGLEVYQNIWRNISSTWAVEIVNAGIENGRCNDFKFYNNVIYSAKGISSDEPDVDGLEIYNNIIVYASDTAIRLYTSNPTYADNNDYFSVNQWNINSYRGTNYTSLSTWQAGTGFDMNSITANPNFVDVNGTDPEDFKLQAGSPALTLGVDRQDYDSDGNTIETIPAGAYITGSETIGYRGEEGTSPSPPSPPPDFSTK